MVSYTEAPVSCQTIRTTMVVHMSPLCARICLHCTTGLLRPGCGQPRPEARQGGSPTGMSNEDVLDHSDCVSGAVHVDRCHQCYLRHASDDPTWCRWVFTQLIQYRTKESVMRAATDPRVQWRHTHPKHGHVCCVRQERCQGKRAVTLA